MDYDTQTNVLCKSELYSAGLVAEWGQFSAQLFRRSFNLPHTFSRW